MNRKLRRANEAAARRTGGAADPRLAGLFAAALAHHQRGELAQAETLYRETLAIKPDHADALHLLGVIASQVGQHEVAVDLIARAIALDAKSPIYHSNLGLALAALKRYAEAIESYDRALSLHPGDAEVLYNRGNALLALRRPDEACESYERALRARPDHIAALCNRGAALEACGRHAEALASYDRVLALHPDHPETLSNRGNALKALGRFDEALASYDRALSARPEDAQASFNRGVTLHELQRFDDALASYDRTLAIAPDHAEALSNRGDVLRRLGRLEQALASYDHALAARPDYAEAHSNRGNVLKLLGRFDDALASYDAALRLEPDYPEALSNRAVTLQALDRLDEALAACDRALGLQPESVAALINRGSILQELGRFDEALATSDHLAAIAPDDAEAQINRAFLKLLTGDFASGWPAYEWRRKLSSWVSRDFAQPEWTGEDLSGKRLLLYAEQGFGDTIQFARYAALAAARGAHVILEVQPQLAPLLAGLAGIKVLAAGEVLPPFDLHAPLLSLPRLFATTLANIPAEIPYVVAPTDRLAAWTPRLPAAGLRVGLAWSGHRDNVRDHERSIAFARLMPLLDIPGTSFVSLQKDVRSSDVDDVSRSGHMLDFTAELRDFADTAAVIAQLDLVITVDTAVAHLAGAMGKPVWLLLPRVPDFRWLRDRETSPWYPSARLFRKGQTDTWDAVIARVAAELTAKTK